MVEQSRWNSEVEQRKWNSQGATGEWKSNVETIRVEK